MSIFKIRLQTSGTSRCNRTGTLLWTGVAALVLLMMLLSSGKSPTVVKELPSQGPAVSAAAGQPGR